MGSCRIVTGPVLLDSFAKRFVASLLLFGLPLLLQKDRRGLRRFVTLIDYGAANRSERRKNDNQKLRIDRAQHGFLWVKGCSSARYCFRSQHLRRWQHVVA